MPDLKGIFAEVLELDPSSIDDETSPENTPEWDSTAAMQLVVAIEAAYPVRLSTSEMMKMRSVGLARDVLLSKGISDA